MIDSEEYYSRIKNLNVIHYAGETSYYEKAPLRQVEKALLNKLPRGAKILDLGCGSGRFSVNCAQYGFDVTGMDITPQAIKAARNKAKQMGIKNVTFIEGDMTAIPFPEGSFDFVFCPRFVINAVATFAKRKKSIAEMLRVVKPGGTVYVESFNKWYLGRGPIIPLKTILTDIGRSITSIGCWILGRKYKGLLPGDIIYKNNKVIGAPDGYAHLPTIFELKKIIPPNMENTFYSIPQILGTKKGTDIVKYFRYSMWVLIRKNS